MDGSTVPLWHETIFTMSMQVLSFQEPVVICSQNQMPNIPLQESMVEHVPPRYLHRQFQNETGGKRPDDHQVWTIPKAFLVSEGM